jgi:hypothetical protein
MTPGLKVAPKAFRIMYHAELGKPYMLLMRDDEVSNRKGTKWHRGQKKRIKSESYFRNERRQGFKLCPNSKEC